MKEIINQYTYSVFWSEEDGEYVGLCREFPSISVFGDTHEQAIQLMKEELSYIVSWMEEEGEQLPKPLKENEYSGRILLRLPKRLHKELAEHARENEVSINQFLVHLISESIFKADMRHFVRQLGEITSEMKVLTGNMKDCMNISNTASYTENATSHSFPALSENDNADGDNEGRKLHNSEVV